MIPTQQEIENSRYAMQALMKHMGDPIEAEHYILGLIEAGVTAKDYADGMTNIAAFMWGLLWGLGLDPEASIANCLDNFQALLDSMPPDEGV